MPTPYLSLSIILSKKAEISASRGDGYHSVTITLPKTLDVDLHRVLKACSQSTTAPPSMPTNTSHVPMLTKPVVATSEAGRAQALSHHNKDFQTGLDKVQIDLAHILRRFEAEPFDRILALQLRTMKKHNDRSTHGRHEQNFMPGADEEPSIHIGPGNDVVLTGAWTEHPLANAGIADNIEVSTTVAREDFTLL